MLGFRLNPLGPFWFEDLVFLVMDEARRLPGRAAKAVSRIEHAARNVGKYDARYARIMALLSDPAMAIRTQTRARKAQTEPGAAPREADLLGEPQAWALATEPLLAVGTGTHAAIALHEAAGEQLDAVTYVLDRMRDELRPMMIYARFEGDAVHALHETARLETSIEALLELSRKNAATRPKDRILSAA